MNMESIGKLFLSLGVILVVIGGIFFLKSKLGIQKLPGDIVFRRGNFTFMIPLATSIVLSVVLTLIAYVINHFR